MEKKQNKLFQCDSCLKEEEGGEWYLELPSGEWNIAYFNNLGGEGNSMKHYCSLACFEKELDKVLKNERDGRIRSFLIK